MIEAISQLPIGFLIALSGALLPGPMLAFIITKMLSGGARTGTLAAAGHILVELGIIALIFFGLGFALQSQLFQTTVGVVSGILLVGLGSLYAIRGMGNHRASIEDDRGKISSARWGRAFQYHP